MHSNYTKVVEAGSHADALDKVMDMFNRLLKDYDCVNDSPYIPEESLPVSVIEQYGLRDEYPSVTKISDYPEMVMMAIDKKWATTENVAKSYLVNLDFHT